MQNLLILLLAIFAGLALLVFILERYAKPADDETVSKLSSWLMPLVGLLLVLGVLQHYLL